MSKPIDAHELPIKSDLSSASLNDARQMLGDLMNEHKWFETSHPRKFFSIYHVLKVPSQLMGSALILRVEEAFHIEPSFTYNTEEWSYHVKIWNQDSNGYDELIVWSPGA